MKQIFLAIFLLAASCQVSFAQAITKTAFTAKVNQMDAYIGSGNIASANTTFDEIQKMMRQAMHDNKMNVGNSTDETTKKGYTATVQNQGAIFNQVWKMKSDLAANRAAIYSKLGSFELTLQ